MNNKKLEPTGKFKRLLEYFEIRSDNKTVQEFLQEFEELKAELRKAGFKI